MADPQPPAPVDQDTKQHRIMTILDEDNEMSLVNLVAIRETTFHKKIRELPEELLTMDEKDLRKKVQPSAMDNRIRMAFWYEVDLAIRTGEKLHLNRVYSGLVSQEHFRHKYIKSNLRFAWMIRMMASYESILQEGVFHGLAQIRKMLDAPLYDHKGVFLTRNANTVIKATKIFQDRLQGAVVQKVEHAKVPSVNSLPSMPGGKLENLDAEIARLENEVSEKEDFIEIKGDKDE